MDPRWIVRRYLLDVREVWRTNELAPPGLVYDGPADFVLREGRWWTPARRLAEYPAGRPRGCYSNSILGAELYGLRYVQGYASSPVQPELVVPHAWNADADGNVIDLTWNPVGSAYRGVELSYLRADDATWFGDADPINDYHRGWPLLQEPWSGADRGGEWEPSPLLRAIRARAAGAWEEAMRWWDIATAETDAASG